MHLTSHLPCSHCSGPPPVIEDSHRTAAVLAVFESAAVVVPARVRKGCVAFAFASVAVATSAGAISEHHIVFVAVTSLLLIHASVCLLPRQIVTGC